MLRSCGRHLGAHPWVEPWFFPVWISPRGSWLLFSFTPVILKLGNYLDFWDSVVWVVALEAACFKSTRWVLGGWKPCLHCAFLSLFQGLTDFSYKGPESMFRFYETRRSLTQWKKKTNLKCKKHSQLPLFGSQRSWLNPIVSPDPDLESLLRLLRASQWSFSISASVFSANLSLSWRPKPSSSNYLPAS